MVERIVLTASAGTFPDLAAALGQAPVVVEEHPLVRFEPPADWNELDAALTDMGSFKAVALTSARAARALADRLRVLGISWSDSGPNIWAVGPATLAALHHGRSRVKVPASRVGGQSAAETLARAMLAADERGPVLFACGEPHREELPRILRENGTGVREVVCYRSVLASRSQAGAALARGSMVVVASPGVMGLVSEACPPTARPQLIAAGPTTAASARALGWPPAAVADEPSTRGVASAILSLLTAADRE